MLRAPQYWGRSPAGISSVRAVYGVRPVPYCVLFQRISQRPVSCPGALRVAETVRPRPFSVSMPFLVRTTPAPPFLHTLSRPPTNSYRLAAGYHPNVLPAWMGPGMAASRAELDAIGVSTPRQRNRAATPARVLFEGIGAA